MPELEWRQTAREDLRAIFEYISDDNPTAALALLEEIEVKVGRLPEYPQAYRTGRVTGTREMVVRPNYLVVYRETPDLISILRILHAAQMWP
ncbi:type II toxin-antitoxin system RelE/ParE family toxin [Sinirhodobacter populi]|uniref:Type II toxin-antitoxin system RelE/ParE family toxin n=1 Tax=Paenirhodobacter populi TaxID=2306993 RepID=A0A443JZS6_9RHOB|nr:type II toxin-antitoxin system RelE/ParE family toxin [Sinirhodobacter populi]RWR26040.1 type II toxin-antitoxin system RelE/ParE family toxin [Sinirhodobacter populi]